MNDNMVRDVYPIPDQMTILQTLAASKFRSQIDLSDAYFQVQIYPEHKHLTAFKTLFSMFNSRVMQQGNCNALTTFSRLISHVLHKYLRRFVFVYLDNIFIFSETRQQHIEHICSVCQKLKEFNLYATSQKAEFFSQQMKVLGHYISDQGIYVDLDKIKKIKDWPIPKNTKGI